MRALCHALAVAAAVAWTPQLVMAAPSAVMTPQAGSTVTVNVRTNVNHLTYRSSVLQGAVAAQVQHPSTGARFDSVGIRLPAVSLRSQNSRMDSDLMALLDARTNPWIALQLDGFALDGPDGQVNASGSLLLGGVQNRVSIPASISVHDHGVRVTGRQTIDLRDYGLEPPRKLGGLIRVDPNVEMRFDVLFCDMPQESLVAH